MKNIFYLIKPGASLDNSRGDGGQLPLEMLPEVVVQLVGGHLVVEHKVDGGRDVGEEGLLQGRRVRQRRVLGDLQREDRFVLGPLACRAIGVRFGHWSGCNYCVLWPPSRQPVK